MDECVFCKISKNRESEKIIYQNESFFSVPDIKPLVEGHSLVISKDHFKTTLDLPSTKGRELIDCIKNTSLKIIEKEKAEGFNLVNNNFAAAGQIVNHVHFHIIPRKKGDGLSFDKVI